MLQCPLFLFLSSFGTAFMSGSEQNAACTMSAGIWCILTVATTTLVSVSVSVISYHYVCRYSVYLDSFDYKTGVSDQLPLCLQVYSCVKYWTHSTHPLATDIRNNTYIVYIGYIVLGLLNISSGCVLCSVQYLVPNVSNGCVLCSVLGL